MISPTSPRKRAETARRPYPGFAAHLAHGAFSLPASGPSVGNPKERTQSASRGILRPEEMNVPGFDFHPLRGFKPPRYSVHVNGPWCITFEFEDGDAWRVDFE